MANNKLKVGAASTLSTFSKKLGAILRAATNGSLIKNCIAGAFPPLDIPQEVRDLTWRMIIPYAETRIKRHACSIKREV
jgi:hypothetical protein